MQRHLIARGAIALALVTALGAPLHAQANAARVALAQFTELHWLVGQWRGSGGNYPAFFEEYRLLDDSTIQMRSFADSTFTAVTDSSRIEFRDGRIQSRDGRNVAVEVTSGSVKFMRGGATSGGYTFRRDSGDQWTATLHPQRPDGAATVYVMRRVRR